MISDVFSPEYWNNRYLNEDFPWDIGGPSPAFIQWVKENALAQDAAICIPGGGMNHDALWLEEQGYTNITVVEWSDTLAKNFQQNFPQSKIKWVVGDFFDHQGRYDLIFEQTFFCALPVEKRDVYFEKLQSLLSPRGVFIGLFFRQLPEGGPPFHCSEEILRQGLNTAFKRVKMIPCPTSIPPRDGNEWWVEAKN